MRERTKHIWTGVAGGVLGLVALAGVGGLATVYGGLYDVAATEEHAVFTRWAFDTTFRNAVESRAEEVVPPETIPPMLVERGAAEYKASCQHCHAGPGVERAEWASGMRPRPPHLTEAAAEWEIEEVYWLVSHGVKMSGMPAFGPSHDAEVIWGIAAFVENLPAMTPEAYDRAGGPGATGAAEQQRE